MSQKILQINTDGGSRGNPGMAAIGVYAHIDSHPVFKLSQKIGIQTNNFAEYTAVIESLKHLLLNHQLLTGIVKIAFVLDSELVVRQITGIYKVKHPSIIPLHQELKSLLTKLDIPYSFSHVLRTENKEADSLVNEALDNS